MSEIHHSGPTTPVDRPPALGHPCRSTGRVKWYSLAKGYGFIVDDDHGDEIFVHHSEVDELQEGPLDPSQRVSFERKAEARGDVAVAIERF